MMPSLLASMLPLEPSPYLYGDELVSHLIASSDEALRQIVLAAGMVVEAGRVVDVELSRQSLLGQNKSGVVRIIGRLDQRLRRGQAQEQRVLAIVGQRRRR